MNKIFINKNIKVNSVINRVSRIHTQINKTIKANVFVSKFTKIIKLLGNFIFRWKFTNTSKIAFRNSSKYNSKMNFINTSWIAFKNSFIESVFYRVNLDNKLLLRNIVNEEYKYSFAIKAIQGLNAKSQSIFKWGLVITKSPTLLLKNIFITLSVFRDKYISHIIFKNINSEKFKVDTSLSKSTLGLRNIAQDNHQFEFYNISRLGLLKYVNDYTNTNIQVMDNINLLDLEYEVL